MPAVLAPLSCAFFRDLSLPPNLDYQAWRLSRFRMELVILFFQLLIGHAIGDFVVQPNPMSSGKNRHNRLHEQYGEGFPPWYYWLSAHALTHAGIVYVITGSALCSVLEFASHWLIDFGKCERKYNLHVDQSLHILFKALYCVLLVYFIA